MEAKEYQPVEELSYLPGTPGYKQIINIHGCGSEENSAY
jgi:hypothetical protein